MKTKLSAVGYCLSTISGKNVVYFLEGILRLLAHREMMMILLR